MTHAIKVYTYPFPLTKNDQLVDGPPSVGNSPIALDGNTMFLWVDLMPQARFAHPTAYVLISGGHIRHVSGDWWPVLNGKRIPFEGGPGMVPSPFTVNVESIDNENLLAALGEQGVTSMPCEASTYAAVGAPRHVFTANHVQLAVIKTNPPRLLVCAIGAVRTSGWKNPRLSPRIYVQPPSDGMWGFDFLAEPPSGIVLQVITPVVASYLYEGNFADWKGVRVFAETNSCDRLMGAPREESSGHAVVDFAG